MTAAVKTMQIVAPVQNPNSVNPARNARSIRNATTARATVQTRMRIRLTPDRTANHRIARLAEVEK